MDQTKKRKREQEKQKRERLVQSKADSLPSQVDVPSLAPRFPSLKRSDAQCDELTRMTKNILGSYDVCQVAMQSMNHNQQQQLLGTFEATPSTPLHAVSGNPFERQFGLSLGTLGLASSATGFTTKGISSGPSYSSSAAQNRSELNRHSVAEAPNYGAAVRGDEKAGNKPRTHGTSDHGPTLKFSKQSSDSTANKPLHRKEQGDVGSRPSNTLLVRKREKGRVRPFKAAGPSSPTGNQQGLTQSRKSAGGQSQGMGELFKVEMEQGSSGNVRPTTPTLPEAINSLGHVSIPPVSSSSAKRLQKLKKRHSHHTSVAAATTASSSTTEALSNLPSAAPVQAIRKSGSVHSNSNAPLLSLSTTSVPHHKHRKPSSSTTSTTLPSSSSSSSHPPQPVTPPTKRKHGSTTSLPSSHAPQNPNSSSGGDRRVTAGCVKPEPPTLEQHSIPTIPSPPPHPSSSSLPPSQTSGGVAVGVHSEEKLARKKRRVKRERLDRGDTSERDKRKTEVKASDVISESFKSASQDTGSVYVSPLNPYQPKSLSNPTLTSHDQTTAVHPRSKVKLDKLNKPRPSNLTIETYGESTEPSQESPLDIKDIHTILKELMCNVSVPSPITPLPTLRNTTPFTFPHTSSTTSAAKFESIPEAPPIGHTSPFNDSDSNSSGSSSCGSSSESSDCDEDNEQGQEGRREGRLAVSISNSVSMEESEDTTTPGWEKVLPNVSESLTPLKTPPAFTAHSSSFIPPIFHMPGTVISPLAPETSQALNTSSSSSFSPSTGSSVVTSTAFSSVGGGFVLGTNVLNSHNSSTSSVVNQSVSTSSVVSSDVHFGAVPAYGRVSSGDTRNSQWVNEEDPLLLPHSLPSHQDPAAATARDDDPASSSSDSEEDESGGESDDEMSGDSSSSSSSEEEKDDEKKSEELSAPKTSTGGSVSSAPFFSGEDAFSFQGGSYGGFFNDDDFISRLQGNMDSAQTAGEAEGASQDPVSEGGWFHHTPSASDGGIQTNTKTDDLLQMPVALSQKVLSADQALSMSENFPENQNTSVASGTQPQCELVAVTEAGNPRQPASLSHQLSLDTAMQIASGGKKRKLERQSSLTSDPFSAKLQPPARKTPRTTSSTVKQRGSSMSSMSVSSESSSESSDSSDDEQSDEEESLPVLSAETRTSSAALSLDPTSLSSAPSLQSVPFSSSSSSSTANLSSTAPTSHPPLLPALTTALPPSSLIDPLPAQQSQLEAGELEDEEGEEGRWGREGASVSGGQLENLWVKIPLEKVKFQREKKPKAKVGPYNVTAPSKQLRRRSTIDSSSHEDLSRLSGAHHTTDHDVRTMYSRQRDDSHHGQYGRAEFHRDDGRRSHRGSVWESGRERDSWGTGRHGVRGNRPHERDRERDHHRMRNWDGYSSYDDSRSRSRGHTSNRNMSAEDFLREARRRKHEADRTRTPGIDKAKAYLESVVYFMRHGDASERESQSWDGSQTRNPFRLYMDTIKLVKCCRSWASDCKQLVALCMRCVSVLYWKLFLLKQNTAGNIQKDLQDFFIPSKGTQKSPYISSLSPIPSPASVGSTTSTGSGVGGASSLGSSQDPSPSSTVAVPKDIINKAAEHVTITSYLHQSMELWQQSNLIVDQYRDFFSNLERRSGRITQFSPIAAVADWLETGARLVRYHS